MRKIKDYDEDYITNRVGNMTPVGLVARVIAGVVVLVLVFSVIGWFFNWFGTAANVVSPQNVTQQYNAIYTDYQALLKGAHNVCDLRVARDESSSQDEKSQRVSQVLAVQELYNRNAADYDARWQNAFQAKYVGPDDVPTTAPSLSDLTSKIAGCPAV